MIDIRLANEMVPEELLPWTIDELLIHVFGPDGYLCISKDGEFLLGVTSERVVINIPTLPGTNFNDMDLEELSEFIEIFSQTLHAL